MKDQRWSGQHLVRHGLARTALVLHTLSLFTSEPHIGTPETDSEATGPLLFVLPNVATLNNPACFCNWSIEDGDRTQLVEAFRGSGPGANNPR